MAPSMNRRALIGSAGLVTLAVAASGIAAASTATVPSVNGISADLAALIATADAESKAAAVFDRQVLQPARERAMALTATIPHTSVDIDGSDYWTTAKPGSIRLARRFVEEDLERRHPDSKQLRSLLAANHRREREAARIRKATGLTAAVKQADAQLEAIVAAEWAVANFACRTASDLNAKLSFMSARHMDDGVQVLEYILPDALRLATAEGR